MSEERRKGAVTDPTELWRQWYEASSRVWSTAFGAGGLGGNAGGAADPFGLYRRWFDGLQQLQQAAFGAANGSALPGLPGAKPLAAADSAAAKAPAADAAKGQATEVQNLWRQWSEATVDALQKSAALGQEAVDLTPRWIATLDQIRNNLFAAEGYPTDPLQLATRWYNATQGPLSDFVGELIEREETLDTSARFLQSYASFYKVFRRNSEEYLKNLQLPVRSDITRLATLVLALEDKIDRLDEAFEDFEDGQSDGGAVSEPATAEAVGNVESRVQGLETRLDGVESKIDRLLAVLEDSGNSNGTAEAQAQQQEESGQQDEGSGARQEEGGEEARATAAARRKAEELSVDLGGVEGTGSGGQITVDDVRRSNNDSNA